MNALDWTNIGYVLAVAPEQIQTIKTGSAARVSFAPAHANAKRKIARAKLVGREVEPAPTLPHCAVGP